MASLVSFECRKTILIPSLYTYVLPAESADKELQIKKGRPNSVALSFSEKTFF
jgi:hypothetical protein